MDRTSLLLLLAIVLATTPDAAAQFSDDFSDGDFTNDPAWSGDLDLWEIDTLDGNARLRSSGAAVRDTVILTIPSEVTFGTWTFTFAFEEANLSNFSGARVFLISDTRAIDGPVFGYYLQLGTVNDDAVRLMRQDGDPATKRQELGRSEPVLLGNVGSFTFRVTRSFANEWTVEADGQLLFRAVDATYRTGRFFGLWVKHTNTTARSFLFDDFDVSGESGPPDLDAPSITFTAAIDERTILLTYSEPMDRETTCVRRAYFLSSSVGLPAEVLCPQDRPFEAELRFSGPLVTGSYTLDVARPSDLAGNLLPDTTLSVFYADPADVPAPGELVINEIMFAPRADAFDGVPDQPEYVELFNRSARHLNVSGMYWTKAVNENGTADTLRFTGGPFVVAPEGYVIIFAHALASADPARGSLLALAFPEIDFTAPSVTLLPLRRSSLSLRNSGDELRLQGADGSVLDELAYDPRWHHPNLANAAGVALERIDAAGPSDAATNWMSSTAPSGGSPGLRNTVALGPGPPATTGSIAVHPNPFSPDRDGYEDVVAIEYALPVAASLVRVRIFDSNGRPVRTLTDAHLAGAAGRLLWDGLDDAGRPLRIGIYVILFEALDTPGGGVYTLKGTVVLARRLG